MDDYKKQKDILEIYADLPEDLQKALFAHETAEAIRETGKKYELTLDKVGELADETGLVMMGLTPTSEYIKNLASRLDVNTEKAKAVADEINQKIFQPVRESLKQVHGLAEKPKGEVIMPSRPAETTAPEIKAEQISPKKILERVEKTPEISPIFVKKFPPSVETIKEMSAPAAKTPRDLFKNDLEKVLNAEPGAKENPASMYKEKDPYKEPI